MPELAKVTKAQLLALPRVGMMEQLNGVKCFNLILIPTRKKHDSGYRIIEIAMVNNDGEPFALHCEHIDAIVFYSKMSSDCINCGLMRFWSDTSRLVRVRGASTVYIEAVEGKDSK